jgi:hypothetical protein
MNEPGRLPYHSTHRGPQARRHLLSDGKQNFINNKETMSVTEHGGPPIATLRELAFKGDTDHEFVLLEVWRHHDSRMSEFTSGSWPFWGSRC